MERDYNDDDDDDDDDDDEYDDEFDDESRPQSESRPIFAEGRVEGRTNQTKTVTR